MKKLKFQGYSDDTFGEYKETGIDFDNCASGSPIRFRLDSSEGSMLVVGQYARLGTPCWVIGIGQVDEDVLIPDWEMRFSSEGYTTVLTMTVPDDTTLTCLEVIGKDILADCQQCTHSVCCFMQYGEELCKKWQGENGCKNFKRR